MTTTERKLTKAGISMKGVTIISTSEVEVAVIGRGGEVSENATRRQVSKVGKALGYGGFRCGHGGWVLRKGYRSQGDFNDKSSAWHY